MTFNPDWLNPGDINKGFPIGMDAQDLREGAIVEIALSNTQETYTVYVEEVTAAYWGVGVFLFKGICISKEGKLFRTEKLAQELSHRQIKKLIHKQAKLEIVDLPE